MRERFATGGGSDAKARSAVSRRPLSRRARPPWLRCLARLCSAISSASFPPSCWTSMRHGRRCRPKPRSASSAARCCCAISGILPRSTRRRPPSWRSRPAPPIRPTGCFPREHRKPGVFFSDFFRPLGLEECLGGTLASTNGRFAMVGLQRSRDRRPFDDDDIDRLEALMPHLARALQLRRSLHRARTRSRRADGSLRQACCRRCRDGLRGPEPFRECRGTADGGSQ